MKRFIDPEPLEQLENLQDEVKQLRTQMQAMARVMNSMRVVMQRVVNGGEQIDHEDAHSNILHEDAYSIILPGEHIDNNQNEGDSDIETQQRDLDMTQHDMDIDDDANGSDESDTEDIEADMYDRTEPPAKRSKRGENLRHRVGMKVQQYNPEGTLIRLVRV